MNENEKRSTIGGASLFVQLSAGKPETLFVSVAASIVRQLFFRRPTLIDGTAIVVFICTQLDVLVRLVCQFS